MTKGEFQRKVIELLKKYRLNSSMREKIMPLFSLVDSLNQEEVTRVYRVLEEAIITHKETEKLTITLKNIFDDFTSTIRDVSERLSEIRKRLDDCLDGGQNGLDKPQERLQTGYNRLPVSKAAKISKYGQIMKYNKQSFPGEKPNFGLKLNKLFSSFITEYGPENITMVVSDSILYNNNLILRISLKTRDVLIGSSRSLKLYETKPNRSFLITDKPEVIPYGNEKGFHFKYITYDDILHLTNGDFFKVFDEEVLKAYQRHQIDLPEELKEVGYYSFE